MNPEIREQLKSIPQIGYLLEAEELRELAAEYSHTLVKQCAEWILNEIRETILTGKGNAPPEREILVQIQTKVNCFAQSRLKHVINATGILLHTGLGRAYLTDEIYHRAFERVSGACNLELDLESGQRGDRQDHLDDLLQFLTGAESSAIVNNNAAAVLIALNTLSYRSHTLVSRGQLIEIGGSFRLPEVMNKSGTQLIEVGATNRTYIKDFKEAITPRTKAILIAHSSNYRIKGFVHEENIKDISSLCLKEKLFLIHDLGGGVVVDLNEWNLPEEPIVQQSIAAGAHVVTFSGDKILGGPQAGILVGKKEVITAIRKNPFMRALRPDKFTLALLEETLRIYIKPYQLLEHHPVLSRITESQQMSWSRAEAILNLLPTGALESEFKVDIIETTAQLGSGALPLEEFPSAAIRIRSNQLPIIELARRIRLSDPPVVGQIRKNALILDVKAISEEEILPLSHTLLTNLLRIN
jgi:L-seryl-tRNA(Ser) seleniumtransferase